MKRYRQEHQEQEDQREAKRYREVVVEEDKEEGEGATCLMLLSRSSVVERYEPDDQSPNRIYECKTCNRQFPSFQALGGHRASHRKPKPVADYGAANQPNGSQIKQRVHECSICGSEFSIGQALGGHMRRHRATMVGFSDASPVVKKSNSRRVLCFDLNLPPSENDLECYTSGFAGGFLERVSMVDCFN